MQATYISPTAREANRGNPSEAFALFRSFSQSVAVYYNGLSLNYALLLDV
jgi:hypothetical protein